MPRPAVRWRDRASRGGAIRVVSLLGGALVFVVCWCLFLTPMHVAVRHDANWLLQLRVDGKEQKLAAYPVASLYRVTITNISSDPATVELALPIPDGRPRLRYDELSSVAGQWKSTAGGERLESIQPGSQIALDLSAAAPEIPFLDRPDGGRVRVRYNGHERDVDLKSATAGWHMVALPPLQTVSVATVRLSPLGVVLEIRATGTNDGIAEGTIRIGAKAAIRTFGVSGNRPLSLVLPANEIGPLMLDGIRDFAATLALSLFLILVFMLAGTALVAADPLDAFNGSKWVACFAAGFTLFALIANTSAYFLAAKGSAFFLGALLLVAVAVGAVRRAKLAGANSTDFSPMRLPVWVVAATALGLWLSFWPLAFVGAGFLGALQMDSSFYVTASNAIQSKSLFSAISSEGLIGNGMRSIDLALVASLSSISGLTTGRIWLVMCMALMIVPPLATYCLVRDWLRHEPVAQLSAVGVALSAPIASLFFECYLVQYVTTAVLYLNLYTALPFIRSLERPSPSLRTTFPHALTSAVALLLYPYFAIVPVATAGVAMWMLRKDRARLARHVGLLVATGLAVGNVGFFFILNHAATGQFVDDLNAIARHVVFPFYNQPKFPAFVFGLAPFHASGEVVRSLLAETTASPLAWGLASYLSIVEQRVVIPALVLIGASYLWSLAAGRKVLLDGFGMVLPASLVGYLFMLVVARHSSGLYAQCKLAWTLATLVPPIVVPALSWRVVRGGKGGKAENRCGSLLKVLALSALLLFLTGNLISKAAGPILWIANPGTATKANTSVAADLAMLDAWHPPSMKPATRFAFAEPITRTLPPTQSLRVRAGHVYSLLVDRGHACVNCNLSNKLLEFMWFEPVDAGATDADMLVMIGDRTQAGIRGWSLALPGEQLSIYLRQSP